VTVTEAKKPDPYEVLRRPFDPKVVGKLPRITCQACSKKSCQQHKPAKCAGCGGYLTTAHIHLDYVGHAEVTDRLLAADPAWNWEPLAWSEEGLPRFTRGASGELELWIKLTVCGVTRLGVGSVAGNAFDAEKQLIGDALRNAAMRFGVALDLWAKEELESQLPEKDEAPKQASKRAGGDASVSAADAPARAQSAGGGGGEAPTSRGAMVRSQPQGRVANGPSVDDVGDPPSTGTRRRKPPMSLPENPDHEEPMAGREPSQRQASEQTAADVADLIAALKEAGDEWTVKGREAWKAAGIPSKGAAELSQADAERAFEVLSGVYRDAVASLQPTLDGAA
jgi:hypothetical protein